MKTMRKDAVDGKSDTSLQGSSRIVQSSSQDGSLEKDIFATEVITLVLLGLIIGILLAILIYVIALILGA